MSISTRRSCRRRSKPRSEPVGRRVLEQVAAGNKLDALTLAREQAVVLGETLAKSAWAEEEDDFNPSALADRVGRVG